MHILDDFVLLCKYQYSIVYIATHFLPQVAVLLMDTQGFFDNKSTYEDCTYIFALSNLISSVQVWLLFHSIVHGFVSKSSCSSSLYICSKKNNCQINRCIKNFFDFHCFIVCVQIYNIHHQLQEDDLQHLEVNHYYAKTFIQYYCFWYTFYQRSLKKFFLCFSAYFFKSTLKCMFLYISDLLMF